MQTLEEWNKKEERKWFEGRRTGVLCPECRTEMLKSRSLITIGHPNFEEKPPTRDVYCPNCDYTGQMIVVKEKIKKMKMPQIEPEPGEFTVTRIPFLEKAIKKINEIIDKR